ncbi:MAG TPA: hypothetical protein VFO28_12075, partial [Burkholderiaceae bacterium]|nr:hypothetical protein [Burkholderiaceae bacterium]
ETVVVEADDSDHTGDDANEVGLVAEAPSIGEPLPLPEVNEADLAQLRVELLSIRKLLAD